LLRNSEIGNGPFWHENPNPRKFTILFNIAEIETPSGTWNTKEPIISPWRTEEKTGIKWRLQVYLQGKEDSADYIAVYLWLSSCSPASVGSKGYQIY